MKKNKNSGSLLAKRMAVSLVCGLAAGFAFMMLREKLVASGNSGIWQTINDLLFQDITTEGAERALGLFYIIGQLFIKALQLVIIPMVFTSIALAIGSIADTRTMGRISAKTLFWFLLCSFMALALAGCVGYATYSMGLFNTHIEGLTEAAGSTGSNPLNVVLNVIPSNIVTAFGSNNAVLSSVFLAVAVGLSMNVLGESRTATLRRLLGEVNDVVVERRLERKVLARVMSYEYLWHSIREVGGAYGTGMVTQNDDVEYLYTYRDPHLAESYEAFAAGPAELAGRDYTENDMNEFIVGAAAKLDTPRKPRDEAAATDCKYFCGITDEMNAAERKSLCSVNAAALKAEAADLSVRMEKGVRVAFGSKEAVEAAKALFDRVKTL